MDRNEILAAFSDRLEPIAVLNKRNRQLLGVKSRNVLSSEAYFIDHAVNHHPEMSPTEYLVLQVNLDAPDEIVEDAKSETTGFVKYIGNKKRILFIKKDSESLVFYRTLYLQRGRLSPRYKKISLAE